MKKVIRRPYLESWLQDLFYCPSCTTWRTSTAIYGAKRKTPSKLSQRRASTLTSSTAINATKNVPKRYSELYAALCEVSKKASAHLSLSRLQLAIQGLESEKPVVRIAFLGLNVQSTARRLVRLLLADPLEDEGDWERELVQEGQDYSQGLLIRYGHRPNASLPQQKTVIPVLHVLAPLLEGSNVEILIAAVNPPVLGQFLQASQTTPSDAFLAPIIETPTAATGRQTVISQPVHSSIVVAKGFDEFLELAELLAATKFTSTEDRQLVSLAIDLPDPGFGQDGRIIVFNPALAEEGLAAIRNSVKEAITFEHKWMASGIPLLSRLFSQSTTSDSLSVIPTPVQNLVSSILASASAKIESQVELEIIQSAGTGFANATRTSLDTAIDDFSRNAHQELQSGLSSAWSSRNWRKLSWYKLFWRVDDVGLITTDLITNSWLPRTERAVYEMSGRLAQAGIKPLDALAPLSEAEEQTSDFVVEPAYTPVLQAETQAQPLVSTIEPPPTIPAITNRDGIARVSMEPVLQPTLISATISQTRQAQISNAISSLTSTAQQLVLRTLSITGLSAGLSGLTYVSLTPGSFYEAGTIVAVGTAFALWRMQGGWMQATKNLEQGLYNEGRETIRKIVSRMKELVSTVGEESQREGEVEAKSLQAAKEAVEKAKAELKKLDEVPADIGPGKQ